jgi:uncharacterized secreted protein with C-terminal beta-propeller domain
MSSIYSPLDPSKREVRLLTFDQSNVSRKDLPKTIACTLTTHSLDGTFTAFDALSYVWGNPSITKPVYINGHRVYVTTNLYDALDVLRGGTCNVMSRMTPMTVTKALTCSIWIDAICINQVDFDKRSSQVAMMCEIYSRAKKVHMWLGPCNVHTISFLTAMQRPVPSGEHARGVVAEGGETHNAIKDVLHRPYVGSGSRLPVCTKY